MPAAAGKLRAKCEMNGNGKDLNRKERKERQGRQRLVLGKKGLAFFAFGVYPPRRASFAVSAVAVQP